MSRRTREPGHRRREAARRPRKARPKASRRSHAPRRGWSGQLLRIGIGLAAALALVSACATHPPERPQDACSILDDRPSWYVATRDTEQRWGVPISVQLAVMYQESAFRADARPPRSTWLLLFPGPRPSTAYGYGQVVDGTWAAYQRSTGNVTAERTSFEDVSDFIGWYTSSIRAQTGVTGADTYRLYLAYHEGPQGFLTKTYSRKPWLLDVARDVSRRSERYERQLSRCRADLEAEANAPWWWPL